MEKPLRRISLLIREEQYEQLAAKEINVSGLVRDLIDDYLSDERVTLGVSESTRRIYQRVIANTGSTDQDLESYFRRALVAMVKDRIEIMHSLASELDHSGDSK